MVAVHKGKTTIVMDLDAFDYKYGDADGPDPSQRDLDALLSKVTRVCVLEGAMLRGRAMGGRILLDSRDAGAIRELASCLQIVEDPGTFGHCQCLGGPTMELYAGLEHVATIGLQHGRAIRWKQWYHDGLLQDGARLTHWLHDQGVNPARLEAIYNRGNNHFFTTGNDSTQTQEEVQQLCSDAQDRAQEGKLAEAERLCTQAIGLDPDQAESYAIRGQVHYHLGRYPEAATDCSAAIDRGFRHPSVYFVRAVTGDAMGQVAEAMADCSMALHLDPEHAGALNSRGLIRARLGQLDEALADFSEAIRLAPEWFLPYMHRAQVHHSRGQLESALAEYDRAIELLEASLPAQADTTEGNPTLAVVYCRRGDARYDRFLEEEAEADFAKADGHHPAATASYLGDMWRRRCQFGRAVEVYAQLVRLCPEDARGYLGRGAAHEALGDLEEADNDYSAAIRLEPDRYNSHALRAEIRHRQGRLDDALADISEHLRYHPDDPMGYLFRSALHKKRNAPAAALEDLNAAHRAAPDDAQVCNNLAWMLATCPDAALRNGARAVALARQACEATDWKYPFCLGTFAAALAETGAFDEAIRWQSEALDLYPESEKPAGQSRLALYQAGQAYRE
jgi:tetratricopeptide (TPR) repeat protein